MADKDKLHQHDVAGKDRRVEYSRPEKSDPTTNTRQTVPRGKETGRDEYVDHAGRRTTVRFQDSGRVDVFTGTDVEWVVADRKRELISKAALIDPSDRDGRAKWQTLKEQWNAAGRCPEDRALWATLKATEDQYHTNLRTVREQRERLGQQAVTEKRALIVQARSISADDRTGGDQWRRIMDQWRTAGRGPKADEDQLWADLNRLRDAYKSKVEANKREREKEGQRAIAAKRALIVQARSISADDRTGGDQWRRIMDQWRAAGRGPKADEDQLWTELNRLRDAYKSKVEANKREREKEGQRAIAAKRALIVQARSISADDRTGGDQWRRIMDQWRAAGRGPKADEDQLWSDLSSLRDAYKRQMDAQRERRKFEIRERAREMRNRGYELESRCSDIQAQIYRVRAATYKGRDPFKVADFMRRQSEKAAELERKQRSMYAKAQELKYKADQMEIKAGS